MADEHGDAVPDAVRRADLHRSRPESPEPDRVRFANRVARAIATPAAGPVASPRLSEIGASAQAGRGEAATDPSPVQLAPAPEFPETPLETTDPGVPPAVRDQAFGAPRTSTPAVVCDRGDRIVRANPEFLALCGDPSPVGLRLSRIVLGPDADARVVRPDGHAVRVRVVRWELAGDLRAIVLVELEEDATAARRWTAELERIARVGTWTYDLASATLQRSPSLEELYRSVGVVPDSAQGPIEGELIAQLCRALRAGGGSAEQHVEVRLPGDRVLSCRAGVEKGSDGAALRIAGMVRDVSTPRQAEQAAEFRGRARHAEHRFADLMATVPDGVGLVDAAGRIADANEPFATLLGRSLDALRGLPVTELAGGLPAVAREGGAPWVPGAAPALPDWLRHVAPGGEHGYRVPAVELVRGDGEPVTCAIAVTASRTPEGDPFWLVVATAAAPRPTGDDLTRLPDRVAAVARVADLLDGPTADRVAVVCGDLDDFARVNSSLGHEAGDVVLVEAAARLRRELPAGCTPARLSADEFVVICADHETAGGPEALARTVGGLLGTTVTVQGRPVRMTASVGVATPDVRPGVGAGDLLRYAEVAMQQAKRADRGGVAAASESVVRSADRQLEVEAELRAAIAEDGLTLHYQPVVAGDGTVLSAEALVRWPHAERGMISPGEFLPVAERAGMLRDLDVWCLRTATREAASWGGASVAVNLAGLLPGDPEFLAEVTAAVEGAGLPWERLILELVETSLVALPRAALDVMAGLTARGVRFAVDDFGTGYSSLARLKELPTQTVKVDRAFVTGVADDPADFAVARAVVDMARAMGRNTVAEGVETTEQFHVLRGLGVDAYQGWLFAKALPPAELRAVLATGRIPTPARRLGLTG